jgi:septum formation protein
MDFLNQYDIILASQSPRRKELLSGLDIDYRILLLPDIDESYPDDLVGEEIPKYISQQKAEAYRSQMKEDSLVITADTIVLLDGKVYGKPINDEDAKRMLSELSGKTHLVITGVCITTLSKQVAFAATTEVRFATLSEEEIDYYVSHYHPLDKAGAYGVQEWIGYVAVENMSGSYFNVMGLPIQRLYRELRRF